MAGNRIIITVNNNSRDVIQEMEAKIQNSLTKVGLFVEGEAKLRCPVDTGNLRGSITHSVDDDEVQVGTDVDYAEAVEKGTSRMTGRPYLTPAGEDNINDIKRIVETELRSL